MITNNELIRIIDFLSGRFPNISEKWLKDHRDDIIADTFQFVENLTKKQDKNKMEDS